MPRTKGPPGGQGFYKDPNGVLHYHVLGTHAAALFFLDRYAVCLLRTRGRGIPSVLGFREGMGGRGQVLALDASRREYRDTSTNVLSANYSKPLVFDLAVSAAGRRQYVSVRCGQVLKVLGVKKVEGYQNPGAPKCKYVIRLHTLLIH